MKKFIAIIVNVALICSIVSMSFIVSAASSYEKTWDFEKCKEGKALVDGDLHLAFSVKNYNFKKEYGNMVLDIEKKKSGCMMNDEMKAQMDANGLAAASFQFRFKITEDDYDNPEVLDKNTNSLNFWFRQHDNANAYFLGIYPHHIDIYDQDATNPAYKDGTEEHANQRESKAKYDWVREKNRWYQINIVTKPTTDFVTVGDRKEASCYNAVYLDGTLILEWTSTNCWIQPFGFELFGWNIACKVDDLKVSTNPDKYVPTGVVTVKQDADYTGASVNNNSGTTDSNNTTTKGNESTAAASSKKASSSSKKSNTSSTGSTTISDVSKASIDDTSGGSSDFDSKKVRSSDTSSGKKVEVDDVSANNSRGTVALVLGIVGLVILIASGVVAYIFVIRPIQKDKNDNAEKE